MKKLVASLMLCVVSNVALADDKVIEVYSCGNDVGIHMQNAGWLVALDSQIGAKRVDRIMSLALVLLNTGKSIGYADAAAPISWCGIPDAKPITVFEIRS